MHYHAEIWLPSLPEDKTLEELISDEMAPHQEYYPEEEERIGFWDWYQIGGRWKGNHVPDYDANTDPENLEPSGRVAWPTVWPRHSQDIIAVEDIPDGYTAYTLILGERVFHKKIYHPDKEYPDCFETVWDCNVPAKLSECGIDYGFLVTVDYHS